MQTSPSIAKTPLSVKKHLQTIFENMGTVLSELLSAFYREKNFLCGDVYSNLSGGFDPLNHIGLEAIHRFSSSVKTKEEPPFQSSISSD